MNKTPLVSVVMSVYNGEKYLRDSVESILNQTFKDFEFIIIDDGSTDNTKKIIQSYKDKRIILISRENRGLVASLNEGIEKAQGVYIARQDDDDISLPGRFKTEVDLLEDHEDIVAVGSSIIVIDERGGQIAEHRVLTEDRELRDELLIRSPFAHGSIMFKKTSAQEVGLYQKQFWPAEDYDLWVRIGTQGKFANINKPLYKYRVNSEGISAQNETKQLVKKQLIAMRAKSTSNYEPLRHREFSEMISRYATKTTFFYRKRVQRLIKNYAQLSRKKGVFNTLVYGIQLLTCAKLYSYSARVAWNKVK